MATWKNDSYSSAQYSGKVEVEKYINDRESARKDSGTIDAGDLGVGVDGRTFVGLNVNSGVDAICEAIEAYVQDILTHLDEITEDANTSEAFKSADGAVEAAVQNYVTNVKTYCKNLCSSLKSYCDKMYSVKNAYLANIKNLTANIEADTSKALTGDEFTTHSYTSGSGTPPAGGGAV